MPQVARTKHAFRGSLGLSVLLHLALFGGLAVWSAVWSAGLRQEASPHPARIYHLTLRDWRFLPSPIPGLTPGAAGNVEEEGEGGGGVEGRGSVKAAAALQPSEGGSNHRGVAAGSIWRGTPATPAGDPAGNGGEPRDRNVSPLAPAWAGAVTLQRAVAPMESAGRLGAQAARPAARLAAGRVQASARRVAATPPAPREEAADAAPQASPRAGAVPPAEQDGRRPGRPVMALSASPALPETASGAERRRVIEALGPPGMGSGLANGGANAAPGPGEHAGEPWGNGSGPGTPGFGGAAGGSGGFLVQPDPRNEKPAYPLLARRQGLEGRVWLSLFVRPEGSVGGVRVTQSSGHPSLDRAAVTSAHGWRFHYREQLAGHPGAWVTLPIDFSLSPE
ncbi:MAG: TonB family protein [Candidatus Tectomicrobia bacterium]|nr:TonB family protein [Candidatus Tectomicrobia bacterium]